MAVRFPAAVVVLGAVLLTCSACTSPVETQVMALRHLESRGLEEPAKDICTQNGSSPVPLVGDIRVVAAVNSTWAEARRLVQPKFDKLLSPDLVDLRPDAKVAICFVQSPKDMVPPDGRSAIVAVANLGPSGWLGIW